MNSRAFGRTWWIAPILGAVVACAVDSPGPTGVPAGEPSMALYDPVPELAYVSDFAAPRVSILDVRSMTKVGEITFPGYLKTAYSVVSPDGRYLFVTVHGPASVQKVDLASNAVVGALVLGGYQVAGIAITPDGGRIFAAHYSDHYVAAIDAATMTLLGVIPLTDQSDHPQSVLMGPGGRQVFISGTLSGRVHVVDTERLQLIATIETGLSSVSELALTQDKRHLLGTNNYGEDVVVIDLSSQAVVLTIPTAGNPSDIEIPAGGREAYVANLGPGLMTVIDTRTFAVTGTVQIPGGPKRIGLSTNGRLAVVTRGQEVTLVDLVDRVLLASTVIGGLPFTVTLRNGCQRGGGLP